MKRASRITVPADRRASMSRVRAHANGQAVGNGRATRPPLIVVGMHRSGTSFVSSLLHTAGLDVGARLMPGGRGNERGHFENLDFVEFHMRWLRLTGHDDSGWATSHTLTLPGDAMSEAREIIEVNARGSAWGWKDPRTTLFLEFWASVVPKACYLFLYREPSEVVDSLFRRGDDAIRLSPELAAQAYLNHNDIILRFARANRSRCVIANVSAVARNPERFLAMIAQRFALHLNIQAPSPFDAELMRAIESGSSRPTLLRYVLPEIERLYASLEREADLPAGTRSGKRISARLARDAFFNEWFLDGKREADMRAQLAETQSGVAARDAELSARQSDLEQLRAELAETQSGVAARDAEILSLQAGLRNGEATLAEQRAQLDAAQRLHAAGRAQVSALRTELAQTVAELDTLRVQLADAKVALATHETEMNRALMQVDEVRTQLGDAHAAIAERDANLVARQAELEHALKRSEDLERRLQETSQSLIQQTENLIAATRAESERVMLLISTVQSSRFWKIKRGLIRILDWLRLRKASIRD